MPHHNCVLQHYFKWCSMCMYVVNELNVTTSKTDDNSIFIYCSLPCLPIHLYMHPHHNAHSQWGWIYMWYTEYFIHCHHFNAIAHLHVKAATVCIYSWHRVWLTNQLNLCAPTGFNKHTSNTHIACPPWATWKWL